MIGEAKVDVGFKKIPAQLIITLEYLRGQVHFHIPSFPFKRYSFRFVLWLDTLRVVLVVSSTFS